MSVTVDWDATFEASPNGSESLGNGDNRILALKTALRERLEKEHKFDPTGTQADHGQHLAGSAISYYQSAAPTTRPDGTTALSADDNGRIWVDSDDGYIYYYAHSSWVLLNGPADSVVDQEGAGNLKCSVVEIGDWDMDAAGTKLFSHGISATQIVAVNVLIRNDADNISESLDTSQNGSTTSSGWFQMLSTQIYLYRTPSGYFDHVDYDSTSYNRGWVTIWYIE